MFTFGLPVISALSHLFFLLARIVVALGIDETLEAGRTAAWYGMFKDKQGQFAPSKFSSLCL
jgi:hypothetical protein